MSGSGRYPEPMADKTATRKRASSDRYHHGDLRPALLEAGEIELAERGIEGFSLRGVAKRAGVSHAAPAHHFGDVNGLLTALAAEGFRRFLAKQHARQAKAAADPLSQLIASGLGYVDFAMAHPALFRLMFSSDRPKHENPDLYAASSAAYRQLIDDVRRARGAPRGESDPEPLEVMRTWAVAHGIADLITSKRLKPLLGMRKDERDAALTEMLRRGLAV
jgi:AcrR family transcriptional regulator